MLFNLAALEHWVKLVLLKWFKCIKKKFTKSLHLNEVWRSREMGWRRVIECSWDASCLLFWQSSLQRCIRFHARWNKHVHFTPNRHDDGLFSEHCTHHWSIRLLNYVRSRRLQHGEWNASSWLFYTSSPRRTQIHVFIQWWQFHMQRHQYQLGTISPVIDQVVHVALSCVTTTTARLMSKHLQLLARSCWFGVELLKEAWWCMLPTSGRGFK